MGCDSLAYVILKRCLGLKEGRVYDFNCLLLVPKGAEQKAIKLEKGPTACATSPVIRGIFSFECGSACGQQQVASAPPRVLLPDEVTKLKYKTPTRSGRWHVYSRHCASPLCHCLFE